MNLAAPVLLAPEAGPGESYYPVKPRFRFWSRRNIPRIAEKL